MVRPDTVPPEYESFVAMAAKGMAQRDSCPLPESVTSPEAFYEVMAKAALEAIDLRALLEGVKQTQSRHRTNSRPPGLRFTGRDERS
jgi:hypothetical protein